MSAIYLIHESPHGLSILPSVVMDYRAGNPQTTVYANLQLPDGTAHGSPHGWWALAPPSHPYRYLSAVIFFYLIPTVTNSFHFQKWNALCCPDFPLATNGKRQTGALLSDAKVINFIHLEYLCDKKYRDGLAHIPIQIHKAHIRHASI